MSGLDLSLARLLRDSGLTISVAESCSGGLISKRITDLPGSSAYFLFGAVTYANNAKVSVLNVPEELLASHGAVSPEVAKAMANGVREVAGSDVAMATTGIAGPDGGSAEKPVGTVYIALADSSGCRVGHYTFPGGRDKVRELTAATALELLFSYLSERRGGNSSSCRE